MGAGKPEDAAFASGVKPPAFEMRSISVVFAGSIG